MPDYDFELNKVLGWLKENRARRLLIEAPDGLKPEIIKKVIPALKDYTVFLSSFPFHGACETGDYEGIALGADHVVHFGHTQMVGRKLPTLYVPAYYYFDPSPSFENLDNMLNPDAKKIALASTVQYIPSLRPISEHLKEKGYEVMIGKGDRAKLSGQVLGCDYLALTSFLNLADEYLLVSSGDFHPFGSVFALETQVMQLDPYSLSWRRLDPSTVKPWFLREGFAWLKLLDAKTVGIVVGTSPGQKFLWEAEEAAKKLRKMGKQVSIISALSIDFNQISAMPFDAVVLAACPRLPYDDFDSSAKPLISVFSVLSGGPGGLRDWLRGLRAKTSPSLSEIG
ncbi:MAG: diphthamide biosynthesis enzyme Dph2 [Thermoprotei archaeon]